MSLTIESIPRMVFGVDSLDAINSEPETGVLGQIQTIHFLNLRLRQQQLDPNEKELKSFTDPYFEKAVAFCRVIQGDTTQVFEKLKEVADLLDKYVRSIKPLDRCGRVRSASRPLKLSSDLFEKKDILGSSPTKLVEEFLETLETLSPRQLEAETLDSLLGSAVVEDLLEALEEYSPEKRSDSSGEEKESARRASGSSSSSTESEAPLEARKKRKSLGAKVKEFLSPREKRWKSSPMKS